MGFVKFAEETWDFVRCQLPDGTYYGSKGKCVKGREAPPKSDVTLDDHRVKWQKYVADRHKDPSLEKDEKLERTNEKLRNAASKNEAQRILDEAYPKPKPKPKPQIKHKSSVESTKPKDPDKKLREGLRAISANRPKISGVTLTKPESDWLNSTRAYLGTSQDSPQDRIDKFNSKVRDEWMFLDISQGVKKHLRHIMKEISQIKTN